MMNMAAMQRANSYQHSGLPSKFREFLFAAHSLIAKYKGLLGPYMQDLSFWLGI